MGCKVQVDLKGTPKNDKSRNGESNSIMPVFIVYNIPKLNYFKIYNWIVLKNFKQMDKSFCTNLEINFILKKLGNIFNSLLQETRMYVYFFNSLNFVLVFKTK